MKTDQNEPKTYLENQVNEDIRPITPFNFEEEIKDSSEMERRGSQDDNQQKELLRWHLKLNHLSFPKINDGFTRKIAKEFDSNGCSLFSSLCK